MAIFTKAFFLGLLLGIVPLAEGAKISGGASYSLPDWFENSFLEFSSDIKEAAAKGKHLLVFIHLDNCPYCARMLDENFRSGKTKAVIEANFRVVALNMKGDRSLTWLDGSFQTEKALVSQLKVFASPTILFFDTSGKTVYRVNGYRSPQTFRQLIDFVRQRKYMTQSLASFTEQSSQASGYVFLPHPQFLNSANLSANRGKPLAVIFEDRDCADCAEYHEKTFRHPEIMQEMKKFNIVRVDAYSDQALTDP